MGAVAKTDARRGEISSSGQSSPTQWLKYLTKTFSAWCQAVRKYVGYVETNLVRKNNSDEELRQIKERIPLGRLAHPSENAKFVSFLCSDDNTYITGQTIIIDGGFTCL